MEAQLQGHALDVAPWLLGAVLRVRGVAVRLTEVEAYGGPGEDPGSHTFRGLGRKNATMFGPPGHLYVYFTYGMHWCANVVCSPEGDASGVLLRAGEIVEGVDLARERRASAKRDTELARGPARLTVALGITGADDGAPLAGVNWVAGAADQGPDRDAAQEHSGTQERHPTSEHDSDRACERASERDPERHRRPGEHSTPEPYALELPPAPTTAFSTGPRTGVSGPGGDAAAFPWRFWLPGEPSVSPYRPHVPKRRGANGYG